MNIHCVSVVAINHEMDLNNDKARYLPLISAELGNSEVVASSTAFYVGYRSTAPLALGRTYREIREKSCNPYGVKLTLNAKIPSDSLDIRTTEELKKTNTLCLFKLRKPVAELMFACWHEWLATSIGKRTTAKLDQGSVKTLNRMTELVSKYPIFLDYLNAHPQFEHIKHYMFKTWISDSRVVTVLALYNPDVPRNGISCDRLPEHIYPVFPWELLKKRSD